MGNLMSQVVRKVNTVLEKLDAIEEPRRVSGGARSISSAGARSMKSAGARSMKSAGARSISSAKGIRLKLQAVKNIGVKKYYTFLLK